MTRPLRYAAHAAAALVVVAGSVGVAHYDKSVDISVDGKPVSVHVFGSTVADALDKKGITLGEHDVVVPSAQSAISDGDRISVRYGRKLTVTVDGVTKEYWTTATTVDAALKDLDIRAEGAVLSASRSQPLGRQGLALDVTMPKKVTLTADGLTRTITSVSPLVSDLLLEADVSRGASDIIEPGLLAPVTEGMKIVVKRVVVKTDTVKEAIAYTTTTKKDSSLYVGTSKVVTKGKQGEKAISRELTYIDGKVSKTTVLSEKVVSKAINAVVTVGTKARPKATTSSSSPSSSSAPSTATRSAGNTSGAGINLANSAMWDRIAQCESGGNWSINTGNGYYGGLQFATASWLANGGADFASRADLASRAQQITIANRYYAKAGLGPWGCAHAA
ncbi:MAG: transglycosylase family protein [Ornithinibacter sp.]